MAIRISPYLNFAGETREAMTFYHDVFGGELTLSTFGEFGMADDPALRDQIMHAQLVLDSGFAVMASDTPPGMTLETGGQISVAVHADAADAQVLSHAFDRIAGEGGQVTVPYEQAPWGDMFGMCVDRFGIAWMFDAAGSAPPGADSTG